MRSDLPTAFVSCFDKDVSEDDRSSFWKRVVDPVEIDAIDRKPSLVEGMLTRNRLDSNKEAYFVLKQGLLFYKLDEDSPEIMGIAKLAFQKIEVFQSASGSEKIYGIKLYSGKSQTKLLSLSRDTILEWYNYLSPMLINRDFFSKYELKEMLGEGAFSQVYKVIDRKSGYSYAAKVVKHKMIYSDKRGVLLMKQEIDIMRQLDHPNVVKLLEVQEVNNAVILILEHIQGCELKKINLTLTFPEIMCILKALVSVVAYLESLGIIHRDLKPSNIMIVGGGTGEKVTKHSTKILDFGLAAFLSEKLILTKCGTPGYIAPEILNQSSRDKLVVNPNIDVYSLGIILYEMVYKCNPFKDPVGKNESKKVVRRNSQSILDYTRPNIYKTDLDQRVVDLMKAMCHRDDRERPLASVLLHNPAIMKGTSLWRNSDYHFQIEENAKIALAISPYTFKVNRSKFSQTSEKFVKTNQNLESRVGRPPMLKIQVIDGNSADRRFTQEELFPSQQNIMSPLKDNRNKYARVKSSYGDKEFGSAMSLEKRFRGQLNCESPLFPSECTHSNQGMNLNSPRNSSRTSSVGKSAHKSHLTSTKKNTAYDMKSSTGGAGLFVLQRCENKDE